MPTQKDTVELIQFHYEQACAFAMQHLEYLAREAMQKNTKLNEFIMGMGSHAFYDRKGEPFGSYRPVAEMLPIDDFVAEWNDRIGWNSLRLYRKKNEIVKDSKY